MYKLQMLEVRQTGTFERWLDGLADDRAAGRIAQRIMRLRNGLFGDVEAVGKGVSELRIDYGPGYRVYFVQRGARRTDHLAMRRRQADPGARYREGEGPGDGSGDLAWKPSPSIRRAI